MDVKKIKVGKTYSYSSRTVPLEDGARGKVLSVDLKGTGHWVTLRDKALGKTIAVRPSQVGAQ